MEVIGSWSLRSTRRKHLTNLQGIEKSLGIISQKDIFLLLDTKPPVGQLKVSVIYAGFTTHTIPYSNKILFKRITRILLILIWGSVRSQATWVCGYAYHHGIY